MFGAVDPEKESAAAGANLLAVTCDRDDIRAHVFLAAACAAVAWPVLVGRTFYYGDLTLQFIPWRTFAQHWLLRGVLPLWLPEVYCGNPFLANDQSAVGYPYHWLTLLLQPARGLALGLLLHLYLAALGAYLFARGDGRSRCGALVTGLAYGLGGYVVSKQQFPSLAYTIAWLPWLLWATARLRRWPGPSSALLLAAVVGLQWSTGHAQMSVMQLGLTGCWLLAHPTPAARRCGAWWLGAVIAGTALASAQLLPTFELLRWSPRAGFTLRDVARFNLPPWQLGNLLLPGLFGSPEGSIPYLGAGPYWEMAWYVGALTVALAWAGARRSRFWVGAAVVGLLLACGTYTPLYAAAVKLVPLLKLGRDPARFSLLAVTALAVLAGHGLDGHRERARRLALRLAGALAAGGLGAALLPVGAAKACLGAVVAATPTLQVSDLARLATAWQADVTVQALGVALLLGAAGWALGTVRGRRLAVGLLAVELVMHGQGLNPAGDSRLTGAVPPPAAVPAGGLIWVPTDQRDCFNFGHYSPPTCAAETRRTLTPNVAIGSGVRTVAGYDPLRPAAVVAFLTRLAALDAAARERQLAALGVSGEWRDGAWQPYAHPAAEAMAYTAAGAGVACPWHRLSPQRVVLRPPATARSLTLTQSPLPGWRCPERGWVVLSDRAAWQTIVTGRPTATGVVRLVYEPLSFRLGLFGSLLALAALVAVGRTCHGLFRSSP